MLRIYSNLPSFKELVFHDGLNILLADKSAESSDRHTRNSAGKSSFVEILHFLMGADVPKNSIFRNSALEKFSFGIELNINRSFTRVERTGSNPSKVIVEGDFSSWPIKPKIDVETNNWVISNENWKIVLGSLLFGLPSQNDKGVSNKYGPTFRSILSYLARRQANDGFISPITQARMQQLWDQQVSISFMLGLDWTIARDWQLVRDEERQIEVLKNASKEGELLESIIGNSAELRTRLLVAEQRSRQLKSNLDSFQVLPQYRELEQEASELTRHLAQIANYNTIDRELIAELQESLSTEQPPSLIELDNLYKEAGIVLPDGILRRFVEVRKFHESVIQNRQSYLLGEIEAARKRIADRENERIGLDRRRAEVMSILKSYGALDQFSKLQGEYGRLEAEIESLRQQFDKAEQLQRLKAEQDIKRNQLFLRLQRDFIEQRDVLNNSILTFEEISSSLYEKPGSLTINPSDNGPEFRITFPGDKSKGIKNMQIFSFDMMLAKVLTERGIGPNFVVHDSHIFDGVDIRQTAKALQVGARLASEVGFQYIVTMNSDALPSEYSDGFDVNDYIIPVRLTDATITGGLFGLRFD